jgi:hypothetical protein
MTKATILIGISALLSIGSAQAANTWSPDVKVASINVSNINAPGIWLTFTTPPYGGVPCSTPNTKGDYWLGGGPENVNQMVSIATAALINSRNVSVYWRGECRAGYPVLLGITLK